MAITMAGAMIAMTGLQLGTQVFGFLKSRSKKKKALKQLRAQTLQMAQQHQQTMAAFKMTNGGHVNRMQGGFMQGSGMNMMQPGGYGPSAPGTFPQMFR